MKKSILLTRSIESNEEMKRDLTNVNLEFLDCSIIKHDPLVLDIEYMNKFSNLIITSNYAANYLPPSRADISLWVVGSKSAKILENKGYKIAYCASSALDLKKHIELRKPQRMLYLSGDHITIQMPPYIERIIIYKTKYLESLSQEQVARYKAGVDYIILYSENCAKTLLKLLIENNLVKYLEKSTILAISGKVGNIFRQVFKNVVICDSSDSILKYII